jgi:hypothetical protein
MAKDKKSFVLYCDLIHTVNKLSDEDSGKLLKHLLKYVNDEDPETDSPIVDIAFEPIKQQLKRDLKDWESKINKRREAGKKGGLAKASNAKQSKANLAVNVTDTVNVSVNEIKVNTFTDKKKGFILWFNQSKFKYTGKQGKSKVLTKTDESNLKKLIDSYEQSDFDIAIKNLYNSKWAQENNMRTISHFVRIENFNKYLEQGDTVSEYKNVNNQPAN